MGQPQATTHFEREFSQTTKIPFPKTKQFGTHLSTVVCGGPFTTLGQTPPRNGGLIVFGVLQKWRNIFGQNGEYQSWFLTHVPLENSLEILFGSILEEYLHLVFFTSWPFWGLVSSLRLFQRLERWPTQRRQGIFSFVGFTLVFCGWKKRPFCCPRKRIFLEVFLNGKLNWVSRWPNPWVLGAKMVLKDFLPQELDTFDKHPEKPTLWPDLGRVRIGHPSGLLAGYSTSPSQLPSETYGFFQYNRPS